MRELLLIRRKARQLLGLSDDTVDPVAAKAAVATADGAEAAPASGAPEALATETENENETVEVVGLLTIPFQAMVASDPHTPATPPAPPETEKAFAKEKVPEGVLVTPQPHDHQRFLDLELRIREIALQLRAGSDIECSTACLGIQKLAPG